MDNSQAAQKINETNRLFSAMGTQVTGLTSKINTFNAAVNTNGRTFSAAVTPIKNAGNALNQLSMQQKTIGSQLAAIGSGFKNNALAIGAAASSVLGLYQNYANLSSAQNSANKAATAAKAAQNNLAKAQDNLAKAVAKYGAGSKEATTAQNKLTVAQERAGQKAESAKIAQDNLNQTMADFGINVLPNIILAGGSVVSIFDNINLKGKGLTGIISKLGGVFSGIIPSLSGIGKEGKTASGVLSNLGTSATTAGGGIKGIVGNLGALGFAVTGIVGLYEEFNQQLKINQDVASGTIKPLDGVTQTLDRMSKLDFSSIEQAVISIAKLTGGSKALADILKPELQRLKDQDAELKKIPPTMNAAANSTDAWVNMMVKALQSADPQKIIEFNKAFKESGQSTERYQQILKEADAMLKTFNSTQATTNATLDKTGTTVKTITPIVGTLWKTWEIGGGKMASVIAGFGDNINNLGKKFGALSAAQKDLFGTKMNPDTLKFLDLLSKGNITAKTTKFDLPALKEQIKAIEDEEDAIVKLGVGYGIASDQFTKFLKNGKDDTAMMNEMVAASINYTKALDDQILNQQLVSKAFLDGIIKSADFFENLVSGTEQEGAFNDALADGAKSLGIQSNLLAFSSTKMQQLIKDTYEQSRAYDNEALASSKSTAFLKDQTLIMGQVNKGMIDGAQAANDWAISNVKATAEGFAFHDQLVKVTAAMLGLPIPINATDEALKKAQTTFHETYDAGLALAEMMTDKLAPSFDRVSSLIQSKDMKELRDNLKKMELPKGFNKDLDDAFKPLRGAAEEARQLGNAMDILVTAGANMSKKDLAGNMKAFGKELDRISKIKGTSAPVDAILNSLKTMSPEELGQHTDSIQFLVDTINKFGSLPEGKAKDFIDMYNKETPKMGSASTTAAKGIDILTSSLGSLNKQMAAGKPGPLANLQLGQGISDQFSKTIGKEQKTTVNLDTGPANKMLSALIQRINSIANMKPPLTLNTKPAHNVLSALIKRIDSIGNMKPAPQINQKPAQNAISQIIKRIDSISKMKPAFQINQKPAQNAISQVINRINSISKMHPSVNVKVNYDTSGKPAGIKAQHGFHGTLSEDTTILAHKGERVDIGRANGSGMTRSSGGGGGGGSDTFYFNIHFGDKAIVQKVKAELGRSVYTMGA